MEDSVFESKDAPVKWTLTVLYCLNLIAVIVLNLITVLQFISKRKRGIHTEQNPYVLCLLATNVLWPLINLPYNLILTWSPYWHYGRVMCKVFPVIQMCFPDAISLLLCLIAMERYVSVIHPFKSNVFLHKSVAVTLIILIWVIPICFNSVLPFTYDQYKANDDGLVCGYVQNEPAPTCVGETVTTLVMANITHVNEAASAGEISRKVIDNLLAFTREQNDVGLGKLMCGLMSKGWNMDSQAVFVLGTENVSALRSETSNASRILLRQELTALLKYEGNVFTPDKVFCGFVSEVELSSCDLSYEASNATALPYNVSTTAEILSREFVESYKVWQAAIILLFIPGVLFPFCYGQIIIKVFSMQTAAAKSARLMYTNSRCSTTNFPNRLEKAERRRRSVTALSIAIQVAHFTCWTPIVVFQLIHFFHKYPELREEELSQFRFFLLIAATNPTVNSFLYAAALSREKSRSSGWQRHAGFRSSYSTQPDRSLQLASQIRRPNEHQCQTEPGYMMEPVKEAEVENANEKLKMGWVPVDSENSIGIDSRNKASKSTAPRYQSDTGLKEKGVGVQGDAAADSDGVHGEEPSHKNEDAGDAIYPFEPADESEVFLV